MAKLNYNFILDADSYKASHQFVYPDNVTGMFSYIEARIQNETIIPVGLQMYIEKYLTDPITTAMVDEAEAFMQAHGEPFDRGAWDYLISVYGGFIPVTIRAVPEGLPIASRNIIASVECTDQKLFWLSSYIETALQRSIWYPTTIATNDWKIKRNIKRVFEQTGADLAGLPFMLHDFGGRGVSSEESAQIGGMAHLVNFMGSDTISGIRAANFFYDSPMAAFSVPASEHTIQTAYGASAEGQTEYLRTMIKKFGKQGAILSIVIDGYDTFREAETLCTTLKDEIVASGAKVVFRPDSGDPLDIVPRLLKLQAATFGYDINEKGLKKIRNVGVIQGDGVDALLIDNLLNKIMNMGFSPDNVVFGSGGALLQKVNRDTYSFAMKASAVRKDGIWCGISKNPATDQTKKSKSGRLSLFKSNLTGEYMTLPILNSVSDEWVDIMRTIYAGGKLIIRDDLQTIRNRTGLW